ncbi:MAG: tRNA (guanosine(37)-N1)-methyltransferase TrmD, partial [Lachnospiraceae bacterium]|nr:tRNA (guanosine(37)-N1)-methyltransferase TrmD [Lachnospiraceae bacterium]
IMGRAIKQGIITINLYNIRDYSLDKHKSVDDYVYGGGNGMLMMCQPICDCFRSFHKENTKTIYMSPKGKLLTDKMARDLAKEKEINILCGHYEGVDERALEIIDAEPISIGDYILTGGEIASEVLVDAVSRHIDGVLSNNQSHDTESFYDDLLEYPQYTRPEVYEDKKVPEILLTGDHKKVEEWKLEKSIEITKNLRPDMYERYIKRDKGEQI